MSQEARAPIIAIVQVLRRRRAAALPMFCLLVAMLGVNSSADPTSYQNEPQVADALQQLERFKTSHSFKDLEGAITTLQTAFQARTFTASNFVERRRELVSSWAPIRDLPTMCGLPPPEADGQQTATCNVDQNEIADPKGRAAYIADLRQNEAKRIRTFYYSRLNNLDDEAMASLEVRLELLRKVAPAETPSDAATLEGILQKAGLSDARLKQIEPLI